MYEVQKVGSTFDTGFFSCRFCFCFLHQIYFFFKILLDIHQDLTKTKEREWDADKQEERIDPVPSTSHCDPFLSLGSFVQ